MLNEQRLRELADHHHDQGVRNAAKDALVARNRAAEEAWSAQMAEDHLIRLMADPNVYLAKDKP